MFLRYRKNINFTTAKYLIIMKRCFIIYLIFCFGTISFAQKKKNIPTATSYTYEEAVSSNDTKTIAGFIKNNPNHPNLGVLKSKLIGLISQNTSTSTSSESPKVKTVHNENVVFKSEKNGKTVSMLNNLFNPDPSSKSAVLLVENKSKCSFVLKFSGNKNYKLEVPARGKNFIEVSKGTYTLTTNVCNAIYSSTKTIQNNISLALNDR